jgi:outer membrane biosynthesis protein TonB
MVKKPILAIVAVSTGLFLNTSVQAFDLYGTTDSNTPAAEATKETPSAGETTTPATKPVKPQHVDTGEAARKERRKEFKLREERRRAEQRKEERLKEEQRRAERRAERKAKTTKPNGAAPTTSPSTSETK